MKHDEIIPLYLNGLGVEIGACGNPLPKIKPIYVDKFDVYIGKPSGADYYGDATNLPFYSDSLDYVASSHVLEHVANPVAALEEWYRVLKPGGIVYLVVPDKRYTFDRTRATTTVAHIINDYHRAVTDNDTTHLDDFIFNRDIKFARPQLTVAEVNATREREKGAYWSRIRNGEEINIHFHVFERDQLLALFQAIANDSSIPFRYEVLQVETQFPSDSGNGILLVLRKPSRGRLAALSKALFLRATLNQYPLTKQAVACREN